MCLVRWRTHIAFVLGTGLVWLSAAHSDEESKRTCASAFTSAQRLMRSGNLLEARKKLVLCGGPQCPAVMRPDCQQWLASVEKSIPTVVFQVSPAAGAAPREVRLSLDDGDFFMLDGRAVSVDPGTHDVIFRANGFRSATTRFVVSEGEKLRREVVSLQPLPAAPRIEILPKPVPLRPAAPPARRSHITLPILIAVSGTALAGVGAIYFGVNARADDQNLSGCYPYCSQQAVDHVRSEYLWTNISIGLAAAGLATVAVLWLVQRRPHPPSTSAVGGVGVGPGRFGATATGTF